MASFILNTWNGDTIAGKVREALPHNPQVTVTVTSYPSFKKQVNTHELKLKGVAFNGKELIFTFEGVRHILEVENLNNGNEGKISIVTKPEPKNSWSKRPYAARVKFTSKDGEVTITLK